MEVKDFCEWWTPERIAASDKAWLESKAYIEFGNRIRKVMNEYKLSSVLELGCGAGYVGPQLPEFRYKGTDGSAAMIAHAAEKNPTVDFAVANMRTMTGFHAGLVCTFGVLKHFSLEDLPYILRRTLSMGNYSLFEIQMIDGPSENTPEDAYNHTWVSRDELAKIIIEAGHLIVDTSVWVNISPQKNIVFITTKRISAPAVVIKTFQYGTDAELLGDARQPGDEYVDKYETYTWYRALAQVKAPKRILELGVRYGYAGVALVTGAACGGVDYPLYIGIDGEIDGIESNFIARTNILQSRLYKSAHSVQVFKENTSNYDRVFEIVVEAVDGHGKFDIIHIDGDHSPAGIQNEIIIAKRLIANDGWIVIDDLDTPHVLAAMWDLCKEYGIQPRILPTQHGTAVLDLGSK